MFYQITTIEVGLTNAETRIEAIQPTQQKSKQQHYSAHHHHVIFFQFDQYFKGCGHGLQLSAKDLIVSL